MGEVIAPHAMLALEVADHQLDGGAAAQFALDGTGETPLLAGDEDPEAAGQLGVVAAVAAIGDDTLEVGPKWASPVVQRRGAVQESYDTM